MLVVQIPATTDCGFAGTQSITIAIHSDQSGDRSLQSIGSSQESVLQNFGDLIGSSGASVSTVRLVVFHI